MVHFQTNRVEWQFQYKLEYVRKYKKSKKKSELTLMLSE